MTLDVSAVLNDPLRLLIFLGLMLAVRGLPSLVLYRRALSWSQRLHMPFITATTMPLLIALAEMGLQDRVMLPAHAPALPGAGALPILIYPPDAYALPRTSRMDVAPPVAVPQA